MRRFRNRNEVEPWIEQLILKCSLNEFGAYVRANVVGVSDLNEFQRTNANDACMLFLSDGTVFIPAVLSAAAWEQIQESEDRETFAGLNNAVVSLREFQLKFYMDPKLISCQFYLIINSLVTVGYTSLRQCPQSCSMLPSVGQQILKTWRSLMKEASGPSVSPETDISLSCLMRVWHEDIVLNLLKDAIKKISTPAAGYLGMATPTHWHQERIRCRDEECFSTPVSYLLIPEEQRKMLTADPVPCSGVLSSRESPSGIAPPHGAETAGCPIMVQGRDRDLSAMASDRLEDEQKFNLSNTRADLSVGGENKRESNERKRESGERESESPWDNYAPAADRFANSTSSAESFPQRLSQIDSMSSMTVPASQWPHPTPDSPAHHGDQTTTDPRNQTSRKSSEHTAGVCVEQILSHPPQNIPHTPPAKKCRSHVHSDGSSFSYMYKPSPNVSSALGRTQVPEMLVRWAVAYLGTSS